MNGIVAGMADGLSAYRIATPDGYRDVSREEFEAAGGFNANPPPITAPTDKPSSADLVLEAAVQFEHAKSQSFFANLAQSIIPPHTGDQYKQLVTELLKRAEEASLYKPEPK